jgi:hypothetical protein
MSTMSNNTINKRNIILQTQCSKYNFDLVDKHWTLKADEISIEVYLNIVIFSQSQLLNKSNTTIL